MDPATNEVVQTRKTQTEVAQTGARTRHPRPNRAARTSPCRLPHLVLIGPSTENL